LFEDKKILLNILLLLLAILIGIIVYFTGGTKYSYPHLIYIPIILSAYFYKIKGGLIAAIIGGLLLGPYMPINTDTMVMQGTENWFFRMLMLVIVGSFAGYLFSLLESQLRKVNKIAYYDPETGLPNKLKLKEDLEAQIYAEENFHLLILSINNFIDIYKLIGFMNFSEYVKSLLVYIKKFKKVEKNIYLINENKYGIIVKDAEIKNIKSYIKEFINYLDQAVEFNQISIFNDITLGVTNYPKESQIADELIDQAFISLEKAEEKKLQYWIYEQENNDLNDNNIELLADINKSIKNDDFILYYQPKVNLKNKKIETFEALIRWQHPLKGFISPGNFIPMVEKSSLIDSLTEWVISRALRDINQLNGVKGSSEFLNGLVDAETGQKYYNIAVNISARNLQHPEFADSLISNLDKYNINPDRFSIEITETDLILEIEENIKKLQKLKNKGIKIYLDDFGKGYSSLKYLKELPVDYLKIDRYFIKNIGQEDASEDIIRSIIDMAHALNLKVVGEGVETKEQLDFLISLNCDYAQGYYFARPDTKENIIKKLAEENKYDLSSIDN
jgi:EAL domain-containing protein (putative c-di-GMP-specific phosphodiesterase class I)/GGDEF domain-containing protein